MKIDGQIGAGTTDATGGATRSGEVDRRSQKSTTAAAKTGGDQVKVSSDAQLLAAAAAAAAAPQEIRQDVVERVREKLAKGELGTDAAKLADALLDDVLGKK
jgi:flagellar biosynthesis anti-sigma factor FlgM